MQSVAAAPAIPRTRLAELPHLSGPSDWYGEWMDQGATLQADMLMVRRRVARVPRYLSS